jgi:predicted alpha/beta-fold hydrolase
MLRITEKFLDKSVHHTIEDHIVEKAALTNSLFTFDDHVRAKNCGYVGSHKFYKDTSR